MGVYIVWTLKMVVVVWVLSIVWTPKTGVVVWVLSAPTYMHLQNFTKFGVLTNSHKNKTLK